MWLNLQAVGHILFAKVTDPFCGAPEQVRAIDLLLPTLLEYGEGNKSFKRLVRYCVADLMLVVEDDRPTVTDAVHRGAVDLPDVSMLCRQWLPDRTSASGKTRTTIN